MPDPTEAQLRQDIVRWAKSIFDRGLTSGSSGNISARIGDVVIATPTNSCLGFLAADTLSKVSLSAGHVSGDPPTKEMPLHLAFYRNRPQCGAVVHLHSSYATALSCLSSTPADNAIPPITPYVVMRAGSVPLVPYRTPGSVEAGDIAARFAPNHSAILIANHGPVATGKTLDAAVSAIEEIEEAAKLVFLTRGSAVNLLDEAEVRALRAKFNPG